MKILIVDDNARIRKIIRINLARLGGQLEQVVECDDGERAVELFDALHPDWVLMDVRLPAMNGLEATRRIIREHPGANVLIVTQHDESVYREEARAAGARGFVLKEHIDTIPAILLGEISPFDIAAEDTRLT
ncbi:MAG: response regulator transcription factor [Bacteroidota bacterium]